MPVYGYRCQSCEDEFEVTQRMSDAPQAECPVCGGAGTRQFFPIGIHFRGSGFYKTDSRSAPAATAAATATAGDGQKTPATATNEPGSKPAKGSAPAAPPTPTTPLNSSPSKAATTD